MLKNILMVNQSVLPTVWEVDVHIFHMSVQEFVRFAICKCILVVYQRIERQVSKGIPRKENKFKEGSHAFAVFFVMFLYHNFFFALLRFLFFVTSLNQYIIHH